MAAVGPVNRLPPDWNYAVTRDGRVFFINELQRQTTWLHPLTGHAVQTGYERVKGLPMGWEHGLTPDGNLYFINHNDQSTTFEHPVTGSVSNKKLTFRDYGYPAPVSPEDKSSKRNTKQRNVKVPVPAAKRNPNAQVNKTGWLHRYESSGIGKKTWRKRWCVLAEYALFFYKDSSERQSLSSILLPSYRINNCDSSDLINKAFAFKIEHENTKTCYLAADSIDELNQWLRSVQEAATLKDSPQFHREPNNNFTNFSKLNNMKLIPKSPIIVQHDDSDDEIPFYEKLSEWEKSWKSPGTYKKVDDDLTPPDSRGDNRKNGTGSDRYYSDNCGDYAQLSPGDPRNIKHNRNPRRDPREMQKDNPQQRYSTDKINEQNSPRGPASLQRWHNEASQNLGSSNNLRPDLQENDPRHQSIASDRSDTRQNAPEQYRHNESQNNNPFNPEHQNPAIHNNWGGAVSDTRESLSHMTKEQLQRMSYDGAYSPKRAENQREMSNQKDYPGRFINTAYHPSLQNLPGPIQNKPDDRIFPEFQDRTQSQPNLYGGFAADHHRFGPVKPPERGSSIQRNDQNPNFHVNPEIQREQKKPPVAAPRSTPLQNQGKKHSESNNQRDSFASGKERDSYQGITDQRNSYHGSPNQRNSYQDNTGPRSGYTDFGGPRDTKGQRDSYPGPSGKAAREGYPGSDGRDLRNSYASSSIRDGRDTHPGAVERDPRDSYTGVRGKDSWEGNTVAGEQDPRDSYAGTVGRNPRDSYPGPADRDTFKGESGQRNNTPSNQNWDSYPSNRSRQTSDNQYLKQPDRNNRPVAAPRTSLSPDRNPGLTIDIPPNYINVPPDAQPKMNQQMRGYDNEPKRPPYPAAYRQQMIEDMAKEKTPNTSQQYLTSAENERKRMEQSPYFQYPSSHRIDSQQPGALGSLARDNPAPTVTSDNQNGGRWEDNSARELRAAYERVQQLQHNKKSSDQNNMYGTVSKQKTARNQFPMHTVKEDPNMSDKDILTTTEIKNLNKKYPLNGSRIRMSISANDLIGKNHDELVLLLIQLRRNQAALEKARDFYRQHLESHRSNEREYKKQRQDSPGYTDYVLEEKHQNYKDLKHQSDELENKLEVYRPIINLVDNMVTMGSLYGGDNLMLATQYRRHLLNPDQYTQPKEMINFSRQRQETKMVQGIEDDIKQLTDEEVDLEDKLERLYELDHRLQEQSFLVTSFSEDKQMLEKALMGILKQQDQKRDDPREMRGLMYQQRTIEKELSRVTQQLAETSRLLEDTTAENNKIDHEVALLRTKVHGNLQRSKSAPSLGGDNEKTKRKMEKELAKVQTMMSGLSKEGERLQQAMSSIRRSSSGTQLATLLDKEDDKALRKASTYMQTDIDSMETVDLARKPNNSSSMPDINMIQPDSVNQSYSSNYTTMSSPMRGSVTDQSDYVEMHVNCINNEEQTRSKSLNELNKDVPLPPPRSFKQPLISHQRQQSSIPSPSEMYNSNLGDGDDTWDIGDADDNTKRFFGLIPRDKPKVLTVRDVKRQSEQRRERDKSRRGPDDLTDDESSRWSVAEGDEPISVIHKRYPSDSTGSIMSGVNHETINGYSQPLYENLPRVNIVPIISDSEASSRRSSLVLLTPKPFKPYQSIPSSVQSSESQPMRDVELPSFMQTKFSTLSASKPYNSETNIPSYKKDSNIFSEHDKPVNGDKNPLPWLKTGSQLMGNLLNVSKSPHGRYNTISSSEPSKCEEIPLIVQPLHIPSNGDLMTNRSIDDVPDVVKSSTNQVSKIDEYSIDDILRGPQKVLIPERYMPDSDEEIVSEDEIERRHEKAEKIKKILAQQSVHSFSQPDISQLNLDVHVKAQKEKEIRNELLGVGQELARQVTLKSKKAAAERRKTWSGGQFAEVMSQVQSVTNVSRTQDTDLNYITYQEKEDIFL